MDDTPQLPGTLPSSIEIEILEALFDPNPDMVFFIKNQRAEYVSVNATLVERCDGRSKAELLGKTTLQVFPDAYGRSYHAQDMSVLTAGVEIRDQLELHFYRDGGTGWCLTTKMPLVGAETHEVVGLIGLSRDLHGPDRTDTVYGQVARAVEWLQESYAEPLRIAELAEASGISQARLERHIKRIFGLTPRQLLTKIRLQAATQRLRQEPEASVADIAHACGYYDHSAFSRQFKAVVGVTPTEFRRPA